MKIEDRHNIPHIMVYPSDHEKTKSALAVYLHAYMWTLLLDRCVSSDSQGWFVLPQHTIIAHLGMKKSEILKARNILQEVGMIQYAVKGIPAQCHYRLIETRKGKPYAVMCNAKEYTQ